MPQEQYAETPAWKFNKLAFEAWQPKMKEPWGAEPWARELWGQALYRLLFRNIREVKTVLDFGKIDDALAGTARLASAEHLEKTRVIREQMTGAIRACQHSNPTPAGLLDLAQALKSIWWLTEFHSSDHEAAGLIYHRVYDAILETLPEGISYQVQGITLATEELNALEATLQRNPWADIGEALRHLRRTLAFRIHPGFAQSDELGLFLIKAEIPYLMTSLAQQGLKSIIMRSWIARIRSWLPGG